MFITSPVVGTFVLMLIACIRYCVGSHSLRFAVGLFAPNARDSLF
jgi:hypothetical protein